MVYADFAVAFERILKLGGSSLRPPSQGSYRQYKVISDTKRADEDRGMMLAVQSILNSHQNELPINEEEAEKAKVTVEANTEAEEELPQIIWITGGPGSSKR